MRRRTAMTTRVALAAVVLTGIGCTDRPSVARSDATGGGGGTGGTLVGCAVGEFACDGDQARECDGEGGVTETIDCAARGARCIAPLGCVQCFPGEGSCEGGVGRTCAENGQGFTDFECDAEQGMECRPEGCVGACAPPALANTYLGCDYFPTVTLNPVWSGFHFAVAVANAGEADANVVVTRGETELERAVLAAGAVHVFSLPWVPELKGPDVDACQQPPEPGTTRVVAGGAYRVRTDQPVTAYQLSPLEFELAEGTTGCPISAECSSVPPALQQTGCFSYSADASLLLPVTALRDDYVATSWPSRGLNAGFVAVTATEDDTEVRVRGVGDFAPGAGIDASGDGTVTLGRGDVLQLVAAHSGAVTEFGADPSGTRVTASRPVQVIAGHSCANVPTAGTGYCDHLEESMLPSATLGREYIVTVPADFPKALVLRLAAVEGTTVVELDPPIAGPFTLELGGPPVQIPNVDADLHLSGDHAFLVTEYMLGEDADASLGVGDPSMGVAVPVEQYRSEYLFVASNTFYGNWVSVVAPTGETVTIDDVPIPGVEWTPVADSGFSAARWPLERDTEVHQARAAAPFGIQVHGYGQYTSYLFPGGLDLRPIAQPVIR